MIYTAAGDHTIGIWNTHTGWARCFGVGHQASVKTVVPHASHPDILASGKRQGLGRISGEVALPSCCSITRLDGVKAHGSMECKESINHNAKPARNAIVERSSSAGRAEHAGGSGASTPCEQQHSMYMHLRMCLSKPDSGRHRQFQVGIGN